ncbi:hypothetical protein BD779DRAFT_323293 [Infundibulicybe gibba]|nr:hypothetical protein BD779DRAFT_323293 [Infundibulicybe gibba]
MGGEAAWRAWCPDHLIAGPLGMTRTNNMIIETETCTAPTNTAQECNVKLINKSTKMGIPQ